MLRSTLASAVLFLAAAAPAPVQADGPLGGRGAPAYNAYNAAIARQARGPLFGTVPIIPRGRQFFVGRPPVFVPGAVPFGGAVVVVPQTVIVPPPRPRTTMDNPFFGDLGEPFFGDLGDPFF